MTSLQLFEATEIRFVTHPHGKFEFGIVAADLAGVLEVQNAHQLSCDDEYKGSDNVTTLGGTQEMNIIWEPGVYEVLSTSRKPKAKPFKKWLFEEVLPSIRKTGKYETKPAQPTTQVELIAMIAQQMVEQERRMLETERKVNELIAVKEKAEQELSSLPLSDKPAPEKPLRAKINEIVRSYVQRKKVSHQFAWNKLYRELYYRCHIDVEARHKSRNKGSKLDIVEELGYLEQLQAIATELFSE